MRDFGHRKIADREDKYMARKRLRELSPDKFDPFKNEGPERGYYDVMVERQLENQRQDAHSKIKRRKEEQHREKKEREEANKRRKLEDAKSEGSVTIKSMNTAPPSAPDGKLSEWDKAERPLQKKGAVPAGGAAAAQPSPSTGRTPSKWDTPKRIDPQIMTPGRRNRWDLTPS